jgi:hypothetical protein
MLRELNEIFATRIQRTPYLKALALTDTRGGFISSAPKAAQSVMALLQTYGDHAIHGMKDTPLTTTVRGAQGSWMRWSFLVNEERYILWAWWSKGTPTIIIDRILNDLSQVATRLISHSVSSHPS